MTDTAHVLYRFYSVTGQLLYVGITMNPPQRFKNHRDSKEWWEQVSGITVENYSSREELASAERRVIQIEHPLHNVVHTKKPKRREPQREAPEPNPTPPQVEWASLFDNPPPEDFGALFNKTIGENRYGCVTQEQYNLRVAEEQAKQQARWDCPLCDRSGYRNGYLCDHIDHRSESRFADAWRKVQKENLQIVQGGDF